MHNEKTIRIGFCDIWNNQGLSKCYQPRPLAQLMSFSQTSPLIISGYHKTSSHTIYCLILTKCTKTMVALTFQWVIKPAVTVKSN